jgi:hypothetical protein
MSEQKIEAYKIKEPIQLTATWFAALVLLVGSLLSAAIIIKELKWIIPTIVITVITIIPLFVCGIFLLQTKFRPEQLKDKDYLEYLKRQGVFERFVPENLQDVQSAESALISNKTEDLEIRRKKRYADNKCLFIVHNWRPSHLPNQIADIVIELYQHAKGPLSRGEVVSVEYELGRKFFNKPLIKNNVKDNFRLEVSAYGPMLCIAKVNLNNGESIILERYIDFPVD